MLPPPLDHLGAELQPYLDVRREGRTIGAYVEELDASQQAALSQVALVMLRPDALLAGSAVPILDWLEAERGIVVLRLSVRPVDPRTFDEQYVTELGLIAPGLRLHHRIAAEGPAAFAIVTGHPTGERSLAAELDELKGASSPGVETDRSTLRARFGRQSSFHVVLHTSEDAGDFLQGAIGTFGWDETRRVLTAVGDGTASALAAGPRDRLLAAIASPPDRGVYDVVLSVKRRIVAALVLVTADEEILGLLDALDTHYDATDVTDPEALFAETRGRFIEMAVAERPLLTALIDELERSSPPAAPSGTSPSMARRWVALDRAVAARQLAYASWLLSGHEEYDLDDGAHLFALLAASSIVLSSWEQSLVSAALLCDVNPSSVFAGRRTYPIDE